MSEIETQIETLTKEVEFLREGMNLLLSVIVVPQKNLDVERHTVRRKVLSGEVNILTPDGSRLNYIQLIEVPNLKKRTKPKKR